MSLYHRLRLGRLIREGADSLSKGPKDCECKSVCKLQHWAAVNNEPWEPPMWCKQYRKESSDNPDET